MDKFESRKIVVGFLVESSQSEEIDDPDEAKAAFDKVIADLVAGRGADLEGPVVRRLFQCSKRHSGGDWLKPATAKLLGIKEKMTYSDVLTHCQLTYSAGRFAWRDTEKGYSGHWEEHYKNVAA